MIGAFFSFIVLFSAIKLVERGRDDLDNFVVATVVVIPILVAILIRVLVGILYPEPLLLAILPPVALIALTFGLLWKHLEIHAGRAVGYTVLVLVVNEALALLLA